MKILNPNYVQPVDAKAASVKAKAAAWFAANTGKPAISFAELVAAVPEAATMSEGALRQLAKDAGWTVEHD